MLKIELPSNMTNKTKIVVVGLGGVGGYVGGLMARQYAGSEEIEIIFLARGEHLKQIQNHGLKVIQGDKEFTATPSKATDNIAEIGKTSCVLICTKSYDLETAIEQIKPCVGEETVIIPLLNGVDGAMRIRAMLPETTVLDGCVYVISRLKQPGVIEKTGNIQTIYFGLDNVATDKYLWIEKLFKDAGIEAILSDEISTMLWEKYIFISPMATATAYFDSSIGEVLEKHEETLLGMISEVKQITLAKGIRIDPQISTKTMTKLKSLPFKTTSSMHRDYRKAGSKTEVDSLTRFVVNEGQRLNIKTPAYNEALEALMDENQKKE
jgi:2-dehydropantoate 2-reductase